MAIVGFFRRGRRIIPIVKKKLRQSSMGQFGRAVKKRRALTKDVLNIKIDDFKSRITTGRKDVTRSVELSKKQRRLKKINAFTKKARGPAFRQGFASGLLGGTTGTAALLATGSITTSATLPVVAGAATSFTAFQAGKKKLRKK